MYVRRRLLVPRASAPITPPEIFGSGKSSATTRNVYRTCEWKTKFPLTNLPMSAKLVLCRDPDGGCARYICPGCNFDRPPA